VLEPRIVRDDDLVIRGPGIGAVLLLSLLVSLLVSAGVHLAFRELLPAKAGSTLEVVEVPSVMGVDVSQARGLLDPKGLLLTLDADRDDPAAAGTLIAQSPLAGSRALRGAPVHATVSRGQTKVRVPDVTGQVSDRATQTLTDAKLVAAGLEQEQSATVPVGTVLATVPPAGTEVARGTEVKLRVSSGPGNVEVPKVTGVQLKKAKELLEGAKLVVATKMTYDENRDAWVVLKQDPAAGAKVAPGSTVTVFVNYGE
jgi:beta-lactam-binding protein with PASTA domain